jgi:hypothetical protein
MVIDRAITIFDNPAVATEGVMSKGELKLLIVGRLQDHQPHSVNEVVAALTADPSIYESDVRSTLLGLIRRNELDLTDDFRVKLPQGEAAAMALAG